MDKKILLKTGVIIFLGIVSMGFSINQGIWQKNSGEIWEGNIRSLENDPRNTSFLYVGTSKSLYRFNSKLNVFKKLFTLDSASQGVNDIAVDNNVSGRVYVCTDYGLYEFNDFDKSSSRIYTHSDWFKRVCKSVYIKENNIYLGTQEGLYVKKEGSPQWNVFHPSLSSEFITEVQGDGAYLYVATASSIFRWDEKSKELRNVLSLGPVPEVLQKNKAYRGEVLDKVRIIKSFSLEKNNGGFLVVGSAKGIFISADDGKNWKRLDSGPFSLDDLNDVKIITMNQVEIGNGFAVVAATDQGVFVFAKEKWMALYKGMETSVVNKIAADAQGNIYAATDSGVFSLSLVKALPFQYQGEATFPDQQVSLKDIDFSFSDEPTIKEVHEMAIEYAEVHPDKIKKWRSLARKKAFLPSLSAGVDRNSVDLFHWNTGANPDELQKGRPYYEWDASLSWDLSELIWTSDQTSIDSRSKLMVELREDILDQVTRLYFERRRLQVEILMTNFHDQILEIEKNLRVDELTALIDSMTGGKFSEGILNGKKGAVS